MEKDYFIDKIKSNYKLDGQSMYKNNEQFISKQINSENIYGINKNKFIVGSFYLLYYDLTSKRSNMEKINPILLLDKYKIKDKTIFLTLNINFLPILIRTYFFNTILNFNLNVIEKNTELDTIKQDNLNKINFNTIYKMLKKIGYEWAIRKIESDKINKVYKINTNILPEFITMSTASFTGVDDNKLISIWQKKIKEKELNEQKLINSILNDLENISNTFNEQYIDLNTRSSNLEETLKIINTL